MIMTPCPHIGCTKVDTAAWVGDFGFKLPQLWGASLDSGRQKSNITGGIAHLKALMKRKILQNPRNYLKGEKGSLTNCQ